MAQKKKQLKFFFRPSFIEILGIAMEIFFIIMAVSCWLNPICATEDLTSQTETFLETHAKGSGGRYSSSHFYVVTQEGGDHLLLNHASLILKKLEPGDLLTIYYTPEGKFAAMESNGLWFQTLEEYNQDIYLGRIFFTIFSVACLTLLFCSYYITFTSRNRQSLTHKASVRLSQSKQRATSKNGSRRESNESTGNRPMGKPFDQ